MTDERSIELEVEVPGTPEEVWAAIARALACWSSGRSGNRCQSCQAASSGAAQSQYQMGNSSRP